MIRPRESSKTSRSAGVPGQWGDIAPNWNRVGPPLRPCAEDLDFFTETVELWARRHGAPRALILGVTPEIYHLRWPTGSHVLAADHTQSMIDCVWPGPIEQAILADWTALPLQPSSRDIALCDGGIHLLAHPHGHRLLVGELHRIVAEEGLCILRLFVPPAEREAPETVLRDLAEGEISSLNVLKLRLGMALQDDIDVGVQLHHVWDVIHQFEPDFRRLASLTGWPLEHLLAIDSYRNCPATYSFLSLADVRRLFCDDPGGFEIAAIHEPSYELGERCPTLVLRRVELPVGHAGVETSHPSMSLPSSHPSLPEILDDRPVPRIPTSLLRGADSIAQELPRLLTRNGLDVVAHLDMSIPTITTPTLRSRHSRAHLPSQCAAIHLRARLDPREPARYGAIGKYRDATIDLRSREVRTPGPGRR